MSMCSPSFCIIHRATGTSKKHFTKETEAVNELNRRNSAISAAAANLSYTAYTDAANVNNSVEDAKRNSITSSVGNASVEYIPYGKTNNSHASTLFSDGSEQPFSGNVMTGITG